jgi:hypothetical protein
MKWIALVLFVVLGVALTSGLAVALDGAQGRPRLSSGLHRTPIVIFSGPGQPAVVPFVAHPHGSRPLLLVPVGPVPASVSVPGFLFWNGLTWVWVPGPSAP